MRFIAYGSEWRKICQCLLFYIGVCATPNPAPNILSFLLRRNAWAGVVGVGLRWARRAGQHYDGSVLNLWFCDTLDKKEKQRRLKTVTKFNPKLENSLSLRQHEFFIVSLSDCKLIVISVSLICHCEKSLILKQSRT